MLKIRTIDFFRPGGHYPPGGQPGMPPRPGQPNMPPAPNANQVRLNFLRHCYKFLH